MLKKYVIHIKHLKQILNHGLVLKTTRILNSEKSKKKKKKKIFFKRFLKLH